MEQAADEHLRWIHERIKGEKIVFPGDFEQELSEAAEPNGTAAPSSDEPEITDRTIILQITERKIPEAEQILREAVQAADSRSTILIILPFGYGSVSSAVSREKFSLLLDLACRFFIINDYKSFCGQTGLEASLKAGESAVSEKTVQEIITDCFLQHEKILAAQLRHLENTQKANDTLQTFSRMQIELYRREGTDLRTQIKEINTLLYQERRKNSVLKRNLIIRLMRKIYNSKPVKMLRRAVRQVPKLRRDARKASRNFNDKTDGLTEAIPDFSGSSYYKKSDIKAGIISDEYVYHYYKDSLDWIIITPENYVQALEECSFLLYVSCWRGISDFVWRPEGSIENACNVMRYANSRNITTVFHTIEDPSDYDRFLPVAKEAGFVFTSCVEKIENYIADTGNKNVFLLEYGINPAVHNPIGITEKQFLSDQYNPQSVFFAGSWMTKFPDRNHDTTVMFDGTINSSYDLIIADRNSEHEGFEFPLQYQSYIIPAIDHLKLQKVHKLFDFSMNANSIKNSRTMCAMRVYELQALGCLMLSNYSLAISSVFPALFMVHTPEEVGHIVHGYSEEQLYRMQTENCNLVMGRYTVFDRLNFVFEKCGIDYKFPDRRVLVLCRKKTAKAVQTAQSQSFKHITLAEEGETADYSLYDYIAYFSDEEDYSKDYITALMNAFKYTDAGFVTKDADFNAHEYNFGTGRASLAKSAVKAELFSEKFLSEKTAEGYGFKLDPFLLNERQHVTPGQKQIAVVVPAYNNAEYLYGRCFRSLLRSSVFDKMQIYLIDDGSTDSETEKTIRELCRRYDNVTGYFFGDGGSGSASRPRNKGLEIACEPYITYLDPDNEAVGDGYAKLYDAITRHNTDFVFGSVCKVDISAVQSRYCSADTLIENPREFMIKREMRVHSIQACLFKSSFLTEHGITNPVGAYGEDSLFFHLAMLKAKSVFYTDHPVHIYYAERKDSSLNNVGKSFFEKFLICERIQVPLYEELGVLDDYKTLRLDQFIKNFYLANLTLVGSEEQPDCILIIEEILSLYGKRLSDYIS